MSRYRFIEAEKANHPITIMCRVLEVSRAGYYAWLERKPSARAKADAKLTEQIKEIYNGSRNNYGSPRVHAELAKKQAVSRKRVARLMRTEGLIGRTRGRKKTKTTVVDKQATFAPNLVSRNFAPAASNRLWVGDMTFIPTWEGWLFLAVLLDCHSRRVVGWAMSDRLDTDLALAALDG